MQDISTNELRRKRNPSMALLGAVALGAVAATAAGGGLPTLQPAYAQATRSIATPLPSFADVIDQVKPAVASVRVRTAADQVVARGRGLDWFGGPDLDGLDDGRLQEFFRRFRGEDGPPSGQRPTPRRFGQAQGSGFFISSDGYLVTNNHVVEKASEVEIVTDDGRTLEAKVIGTDPKTDLALLKADGRDLPFVKLAPAAPRIGDWVLAVGNPFGLGGTVTAGIVSAKHRDLGAGPYDDFIQIDAAVNRGNSGGPTFNLKGEVVGVNTAIFSPSGGNVGLAFAIPASTVQLVVDQLKQDGVVSRAYLGVQIQPVTSDIADGLGLPAAKGALVSSVQGGTPAAKAGVRAGDVITAVNGEPVADAKELTRKVGTMKPGSQAEITYLRERQQRTATVELGTLPGEAARAERVRPVDEQPRLGLQLAPSRGEAGVTVVEVDPDGPAAEKGIKRGDVIVEVGGRAVSSPDDVKAGLEAARKEGRKAVLMRIKSGNDVRFVALALPTAG
jgi:serine protease Do